MIALIDAASLSHIENLVNVEMQTAEERERKKEGRGAVEVFFSGRGVCRRVGSWQRATNNTTKF